MGPSKIRKAIGAVKDQTSIGLAKVGGTASLSDLDVAIVKATRHEEYPPDERYVREILSLTSYSHAYVGACVSTISRRLNKTKNWVVALKTLMLIQRLLSEGDVAYEQEIFFATRRGTRLLNMSDFRDVSGKSNAWDYSAFVRTYALYLDEKLEFRMQGRRGKRSGFSCSKEEEEDGGSRGGGGGSSSAVAVVKQGSTPVREMKIEKLFSKVHHLMQLLERFLACKPTGSAKHNRVVTMAFYPLVKDSFQLYYDIMEIMAAFLERFQQLDVPNSVKVYEFFTRLSKQYEELDAMYNWCKTAGIARSSEYPEVEKIPKNRLDVLDDIIQRKSKNVPNSNMPNPEIISVIEKTEPAPSEDHDMNAIKALPPPEGFETDRSKDKPEEAAATVHDKPKEEKNLAQIQQEGDLLNLSENEQSTEEHGNRLALALFDADSAKSPETTATPWEAFKEDWETALVQTASHLSNQKASLAGGFDTLMLDGMYHHGMTAHAAVSSGYMATGSASSVAKPAVLALPAPPAEANGSSSTAAATTINSDPFAASLSVAPPSYVQMSEMENKQRLLVEEQVMWQHYARDGMQGLVGLGKIQQQNQYPHNTRMY
ncbi:putative clathrin assembly protein At1g03050 [Henckelia pumila]|uniref:putative clathrin assembly protein At1g03050 n=1 Tax=Henckelia pumila TaxID=405737 RepID=UPI003C6DF953